MKKPIKVTAPATNSSKANITRAQQTPVSQSTSPVVRTEPPKLAPIIEMPTPVQKPLPMSSEQFRHSLVGLEASLEALTSKWSERANLTSSL